jgi:hypothetical protein
MGTFGIARAGRVRRRVAAAALSGLALAGVVCGGTATAQASDLGTATAATAATGAAAATGATGAAGAAGAGCPASVTGGTAVTTAGKSWTAGVPWRGVGRGWILAAAARSKSLGSPETLYLVSPDGRRYRLGPAPANATLEDWSGNGTNALFFSEPLGNSTTGSIIVLNLHTGRASRFTVYSGTAFPGLSFSRPAGTAILFQGNMPDGAYLPLQRFSLTGTRELCYPTRFAKAGAVDGGFRENASGTQIVFGTQNGLEVVSNAGRPTRALAIHQPFSCELLNWWNTQSVLADCSGQLLAYPLSGGRPDQLTTSRDPGTFLGAWHLPSGTYAEAAACGSTWLERLSPNGTATTLTIPGAADAGTVQPLGTYGDQLPLLVGGGCDGHYAFSLVDWYNPAANTARTVIGGPAGGGYVVDAVLFPAG